MEYTHICKLKEKLINVSIKNLVNNITNEYSSALLAYIIYVIVVISMSKGVMRVF